MGKASKVRNAGISRQRRSAFFKRRKNEEKEIGVGQK
jgi:hypothetical protein